MKKSELKELVDQLKNDIENMRVEKIALIKKNIADHNSIVEKHDSQKRQCNKLQDKLDKIETIVETQIQINKENDEYVYEPNGNSKLKDVKVKKSVKIYKIISECTKDKLSITK